MTRDEAIEYIADLLWSAGVGSRATNHAVAEKIVDNLVAHGVMTLKGA